MLISLFIRVNAKKGDALKIKAKINYINYCLSPCIISLTKLQTAFTHNSLCHRLSILFTKSLEEMNAHYTWKEGHITPLHKKGSKGEPGNNRPVSLTSLLAKCMEAFIREAVLKHMMANNLFLDEQHGFVLVRSCMTQLLTVLRDWTN